MATIATSQSEDRCNRTSNDANATRADFTINYNPADIGKQAYIVARWFNSKGQMGPNSLAAAAPIAA